MVEQVTKSGANVNAALRWKQVQKVSVFWCFVFVCLQIRSTFYFTIFSARKIHQLFDFHPHLVLAKSDEKFYIDPKFIVFLKHFTLLITSSLQVIYKTRNTGTGNGMRGMRGRRGMFTRIPGNVIILTLRGMLVKISGNIPRDSGEC